jgi:hypothetical protein
LALVNAARYFGVRFISRPSTKYIKVEDDITKIGGLEENQ